MKTDYDILHKMGFFDEEFRPSTRTRNVFLKGIMKKIKGEKILDIGAGSGGFDCLLEESNSVISTDISFLAMKEAKENLRFSKYLVSSAESLPFEDNSFSMVMLLDVIEHIENREAVVEEVYRVLCKDGLLLISVPEDMSLYNSIDRDVGHFLRYTKDELINTLRGRFAVKWLSDLGFPFMRIYYKLLPLFHSTAVNMAKEEGASFIVKLLSGLVYVLFLFDFLFRGNYKGILIFGMFQKIEETHPNPA